MPTVNIQIIAGQEMTLMVHTIREILRKENNLEENSTITNGYVLNSTIRFLSNDVVDFADVNYWENINKESIDELLSGNVNESGQTMKFRVASLSDEKIKELSQMLSETFGSRIRKNYIVKLILKSYIIERNKICK